MHTSKLESKHRIRPALVAGVRFAIVGNARTGSSHLASLLDSHPGIACWNDEIFNPGQAFDVSSYTDPAAFLRERVFSISSQAVGFKLLWDAMTYTPDVWQLLKTQEIVLIHTVRANLLDSYISLRLATINRVFSSWYSNELRRHVGKYQTKHFVADFAECVEWFEAVEHHDDEIRRCSTDYGIPRLEIEYKELCAHQGPVLDFLCVSRYPLTSRLTKQRQGRQSEIILNYTSLKEQFGGSKWIAHFED